MPGDAVKPLVEFDHPHGQEWLDEFDRRRNSPDSDWLPGDGAKEAMERFAARRAKEANDA